MKSVDQMKRVVVTVVLAGYWAQWYDPLWSRTYQLNGVIALTLWPIAVDRVGVLGGRLRQTNVVVPDTVIFAVKPENGASYDCC